MIKAWRAFNFKSLRQETPIEMAPLTLFAGANSSGKSTILQSILLIAQTIQSRVASRSVVLNGPLVRLGAFDDVKSFGAAADQILVGWTLENLLPGQGVRRLVGEVAFDLGGGPLREPAQLNPQLFSCEIGGDTQGAINLHTSKITIRRANTTSAERMRELGVDEERPDVRAALEYIPEVTPMGAWDYRDLRQEELLGCELRHFLPHNLLARIDKTRPAPFTSLDLVPLGQEGMGLMDYLEYALGAKVKYLGPLRDEPKPLYPMSTSADPTDCGLRGEFTAAVLDLHKNQRITYLSATQFTNPEVMVAPITRTLLAAALDWLRYLGVVDGLETVDRGKLGHELKVTTPGVETPHDLTHVGVGVSQVLPIVVMCLLATSDTTLIFEQPELHLHPRVQTLLADFFLSIALTGRQLLVETHSEYLINRLRFRAASARGEGFSSVVKMYFVEKKGGSSNFRPVEVNRYGAILDWPDGFFDQSQREAERILKAAIDKKRQEREDAKAGAARPTIDNGSDDPKGGDSA